ncbi:MAG: TrkG [Chlamydiales bacterium]|jgi:trk system potassium uptake protein TrkH|nr:TrkG [Chlamydiales bacterium]
MSFRSVCKILGFYISLFTFALTAPLLLAYYYEWQGQADALSSASEAFFQSVLISLLTGSVFTWVGFKANGNISYREGILAVVAIWFFSAALGALPFYLSGTLERPIDAYFESVSGLTTTGATVMHPKKYDPVTHQEELLENTISIFYKVRYAFKGTIKPLLDEASQEPAKEGIEAVAKPLLFWRSLMQWLGGTGIVVLFVAVLPALGMGGKLLFQAEVPGPSKEGITPRIKETASLLWLIYCAVSLAQVALLLLFNEKLSLYDAFVISLSTVSTGGFSCLNSSLAGYQDLATEVIVMIFMLLGSLNFALYYYLLRGKFFRLLDVELLLFLGSILLFGGIVSWRLVGSSIDLLDGTSLFDLSYFQAMRYGFFQVISAQSSTGFATADYDLWPPESQVMIFLVMFLGGMAGSTTGGIKIMRLYMLFKICNHTLEMLFRPNRIRLLRINGRELTSNAMVLVLCYFFAFIGLSVIGAIALTWDGVDPETALSVVSCMMNNTGLAFRMAGPTESCAFLSTFSKIVSIFLMVLGRLEIFVVLVLFTPSFWRK